LANIKKMEMRLILALIAGSLTLASIGQDTLYFNKNDDTVFSNQHAYKYEVIFRDINDTNIVLSKTYYISGQIYSEGKYNPYSEKEKQGLWKEWYESGQLKSEKNYENSIMNGQLLTYWEDGQIKRQDFYDYGDLTKGKVWNEKGKKVKYYDYIILPKFKGGINNLFNYLKRNVQYPLLSKNLGIQGRVVVQFVIENDGKVSNVIVLESVNKELDEEAIRVLNNMPAWSPGLIDGETVRMSFNLPIKFTLGN